MKKILITFGIIFLCLMVLGVAGILALKSGGEKLDKESKSYVDKAVPAIVESWNVEELMQRASAELLEVVPSQKVNELFKLFSAKLGRLKEYQGSKGEANISINVPRGMTITALYHVEALFEKGGAVIKVRVVKKGDDWQFLEFRVNFENLLK